MASKAVELKCGSLGNKLFFQWSKTFFVRIFRSFTEFFSASFQTPAFSEGQRAWPFSGIVQSIDKMASATVLLLDELKHDANPQYHCSS